MSARKAARVSHPDPMTTHVRVQIDNSQTEAGLEKALDALIEVARRFPAALGKNATKEVPPFLLVTFHGYKRWLSERRFFERAARHPGLRAKIATYIGLVSPKEWKSDPFYGAGFWTSMDAPAGSLAAVPLALADVAHVDTAIRHLRGVDLDHETFHRSFVTELVKRWGLRDETLRLLAFRAVDGAGQHGMADLHWLRMHGGLGPIVENERGLETFARLVHSSSKRDKYRPLYVANAGKALFSDARLDRWFGFFEARGLKFDDDARQVRKQALSAPKAWSVEWENAASCTDRD